jgi:hypothetical protein
MDLPLPVKYEELQRETMSALPARHVITSPNIHAHITIAIVRAHTLTRWHAASLLSAPRPIHPHCQIFKNSGVTGPPLRCAHQSSRAPRLLTIFPSP